MSALSNPDESCVSPQKILSSIIALESQDTPRDSLRNKGTLRRPDGGISAHESLTLALRKCYKRITNLQWILKSSRPRCNSSGFPSFRRVLQPSRML